MSAIEILTPAALAERLADPAVAVLDGSYYLPAMARDADAEFLAGHIPGAQRFDIDRVKDRASALPHMLPDPDTFAAAAGLLGIDETTFVVAYDGLGLFSAPRVAWTFRVFGSRRVGILDGGLPAWIAEGRPTESGPERPRPAAVFRPSPDLGAVASLSDVREALASPEIQVVDARAAARFSGAEPEPRPGTRSGHMPGAANLHYAELLRHGRLADPAVIDAALARAGVDPSRPIVASCGSGVTAAILSLALEHAGHRPARIYDGSWAEWGSRDDTPVEGG